jgi:outer membrane protein OmpA-like peptidoglycan-associated protein
VIQPDAEPVLAALFEGLGGDASAAIRIEGHTSSEGPDAYNQALSERRAQSVVDDLIRRGINAGRLEALGMGETRPIADNGDENGRAMNRRVEVVCS